VLSQNVHKMPSIVLSISIRGIDYIDSISKVRTVLLLSYFLSYVIFPAGTVRFNDGPPMVLPL